MAPASIPLPVRGNTDVPACRPPESRAGRTNLFLSHSPPPAGQSVSKRTDQASPPPSSLTFEPLVILSSSLIKPASASCKPGSSSRALNREIIINIKTCWLVCPSSFKYHILLKGGVKRHTGFTLPQCSKRQDTSPAYLSLGGGFSTAQRSAYLIRDILMALPVMVASTSLCLR